MTTTSPAKMAGTFMMAADSATTINVTSLTDNVLTVSFVPEPDTMMMRAEVASVTVGRWGMSGGKSNPQPGSAPADAVEVTGTFSGSSCTYRLFHDPVSRRSGFSVSDPDGRIRGVAEVP